MALIINHFYTNAIRHLELANTFSPITDDLPTVCGVRVTFAITHTHIDMYIYIERERERESKREGAREIEQEREQ